MSRKKKQNMSVENLLRMKDNHQWIALDCGVSWDIY